ncbi:staphylococcal nuclease [Leucogyrophana mollusca]|uniref:Staphylococcal nuclease n=1 Tax=Leucogyrophana mollusca TaxID=85980 RepID=A0ACB8BGI4_9AGAM|nr:staphylococcal nuclease [Leucogyrophana mollusca]
MPLLSWPSREPSQSPSQPKSEGLAAAKNNIKNRLRSRANELVSRPITVIALSAFALGSVSTLAAAFTYRRYFRRLRTSEWITPDVLARKRWIKGVVTSVGDADNFRLYHTPGIGWRWPLKFRRVPSLSKGGCIYARAMIPATDLSPELKDQTIHIRIAGVDAPEAAHFGRPAQPYAAESLAWLKGQIEGKTMYCQLIRRDQYSRVVSVVAHPPRFLPGFLVSGKSLALGMLKAGWVTTYEQAGAEYGSVGKDEFLRVESAAKVARRGMWKSGTAGETPAQYKRRYAQSSKSAEAGELSKAGSEAGRSTVSNWMKRLWSSR